MNDTSFRKSIINSRKSLPRNECFFWKRQERNSLKSLRRKGLWMATKTQFLKVKFSKQSFYWVPPMFAHLNCLSDMNYSIIVFISSPLFMDQEILLVTITLNQDNSASFLEAQPFWKNWVQLIWTQSRRCNPREHSLNDNGWSKRPFQLQPERPSPLLDISQMLNQRRKDSFSNMCGTKWEQ